MMKPFYKNILFRDYFYFPSFQLKSKCGAILSFFFCFFFNFLLNTSCIFSHLSLCVNGLVYAVITYMFLYKRHERKVAIFCIIYSVCPHCFQLQTIKISLTTKNLSNIIIKFTFFITRPVIGRHLILNQGHAAKFHRNNNKNKNILLLFLCSFFKFFYVSIFLYYFCFLGLFFFFFFCERFCFLGVVEI